MSSALCSVAIEMVEPATNTGSSTAYGVFAPVRPTLTSISEQLRVRLLRGKLERGRPARKLRGRAEPLAQREVVHLDDDAVGVELEVAPLVGPLAAELEHRVDARAALPVRLDRQPPGRAAPSSSLGVASAAARIAPARTS